MEEVGTDNRALDLLRAVLAELERVATQRRSEWTCLSHLPVVPHAAQLSLFGLLVLKGIESHSPPISVNTEKLGALLAAASQTAQGVWADAISKGTGSARDKLLNDQEAIRPAVMKAVEFADRSWGRIDLALSEFIDNVQDALADLTGRYADLVEKKLVGAMTDGSASGVPSAVYGALAVASVAGGMVGRRVMSDRETSAVRVAVKLAAKKGETEKAEPEPAKRIRRTLKKLGPHLPEKRA